jgi:Domain of unknown function (DUF1932)
LASAVFGAEEIVLASLGNACPLADTVNVLLSTTVAHAARRAEEAAISAGAVGLEPRMTRATAACLEWVVELGLKEILGGGVPRRWQDAIAAIEIEISHANKED